MICFLKYRSQPSIQSRSLDMIFRKVLLIGHLRYSGTSFMSIFKVADDSLRVRYNRCITKKWWKENRWIRERDELSYWLYIVYRRRCFQLVSTCHILDRCTAESKQFLSIWQSALGESGWIHVERTNLTFLSWGASALTGRTRIFPTARRIAD